LHARVRVRDEARDELPVARVVEPEVLVRRQARPVGAEVRERPRLVRPARPVEHVEREIDVAPVLVRRVAVDLAAADLRELADRELAARVAARDVRGGALHELRELPRPVEAAARLVGARVAELLALLDEHAAREAPLPRVADRAARACDAVAQAPRVRGGVGSGGDRTGDRDDRAEHGGGPAHVFW
jgi:hypothetical protein